MKLETRELKEGRYENGIIELKIVIVNLLKTTYFIFLKFLTD